MTICPYAHHPRVSTPSRVEHSCVMWQRGSTRPPATMYRRATMVLHTICESFASRACSMGYSFSSRPSHAHARQGGVGRLADVRASIAMNRTSFSLPLAPACAEGAAAVVGGERRPTSYNSDFRGLVVPLVGRRVWDLLVQRWRRSKRSGWVCKKSV